VPAAEIEPQPEEPETIEAEALATTPQLEVSEVPEVVEAEASEAMAAVPESPAEPAPAIPESAEAPEVSSRPARPGVPSVVSTSEVDAAKADEWDDDISPELAALLFRPKKPEAREKIQETPAEPVSPAAESMPAVETAPPAEPIHLTRIEEARTLPITAQGVSSPPPQIQPQGKARYQRIEEPLADDAGQRTEERWDFRGPEYPMVNGRAVKGVASQEIAYADGSWRWTFERIYTDGGLDSREVRANTDHTYIERRDAVRSKDQTTDKQTTRKEQEAMILAGPPREEKRGLLSSLLGRGDEENGAKVWRAASSHEAGRARKDGGMAFGRKLLGLF
jgi:hypothetical protein